MVAGPHCSTNRSSRMIFILLNKISTLWFSIGKIKHALYGELARGVVGTLRRRVGSETARRSENVREFYFGEKRPYSGRTAVNVTPLLRWAVMQRLSEFRPLFFFFFSYFFENPGATDRTVIFTGDRIFWGTSVEDELDGGASLKLRQIRGYFMGRDKIFILNALRSRWLLFDYRALLAGSCYIFLMWNFKALKN